VKYAFIHTQWQHHHVKLLCLVLGVSRSGYYAWLSRTPSRRAQSDQHLLQQIRRVHAEHREHSGALKTWRVLQRQGIACGKHRVARLRRLGGIVAKRRKRFIATTRSKGSYWRAPNLLQRDFSAERPDQVWVGDVTFVPTREGWLYLAILIDLYARLVVGWSMSSRNNTPLVLSALEMAIARRQPGTGLIHHSDQGQTYAASAYCDQLNEYGMRPSMSRRGEPPRFYRRLISLSQATMADPSSC
jgi:putative transposase